MNVFRSHPTTWLEARALAEAGILKVRWDDWLDNAPPAMPPGVDLTDKVEGMMLGLAIGDALGNTTESLNPAERRARHGWIQDYLPNRHVGGRAVGLPSDDSQLAFRTLAHLVELGRLEPQLLSGRLAEPPIFGIGLTTSRWLDAFLAGVPWHRAGAASAGNGALMRIAPIVVPHLQRPSRELWSDALLAAHLTHDDELSNVSCVAMIDALWRAIATQGQVPDRWWLDRWLEVAEALGNGATYPARNGHPPGFVGTIIDLVRDHVEPALAQQLPVDAAGEIWHSGAYLPETVPTVLYILERFGHDPREAILQAVNQTRDNDTVAAIVGAAVGALHGAAALPAEWVGGLSGRLGMDDDDHVFQLLAAAGRRFGHGATPGVEERAGRYRRM
jgi:ADP-ribosylglycohydrolase